MKSQIKVGKTYTIIAVTSGHGFLIGDTVKVMSPSGSGRWLCIGVEGDAVGLQYNCYASDLNTANLTRKERVAELQSDNEELEKTLATNKEEMTRLSRYETDEEEIASLIVMASDPAKPEAERVKAITAILSERTKTSFI